MSERDARPVRVESVADQAPTGWDESTVAPSGGHVLQSAAWAEHRRGQGWTPHFVDFSDGRRALVLSHEQRPLPGFVAYAPRGPIAAGDPAQQVAARGAALAEWLRPQGATILAVDPELDADPAYDTALADTGFRETEEIQPSRHRLVLPLPAGADEEAVLAGMAKQARQRIRAAEKAGTEIREDAAGERLETFGGLLDATARRKGFGFDAESGFIAWWRKALVAGLADFLVAENAGRLLGGLVLYRQGGHRATAFSADDTSLRHDYAGTMHLLRWSAIRMALAEGAPSIDLGGVDLPGLRRMPEQSDPSWGMYEHKRSFGAQWVESAAAHEVVLRPAVYRLGLAARAVRQRLRRR